MGQAKGWLTNCCCPVSSLSASRRLLDQTQSFDGGLRKHPAPSIAKGMLGTRVLIQGPNHFSGVSLKRNGIFICSSSIRKSATSLTVIYSLKSTLFSKFKYKPQHFKNLCSIRFFEHCMLQQNSNNSQWYCRNNHRNKDCSNIPSGSLLCCLVPMQQECVNYSNVPCRKRGLV